ncbi:MULTISPECIES: hypothetical protein [unclassified Psychrobacter]|uniref:hypothetical protein n=1 Tax=unclassified Psychrobacter TaxID=196806 RepID=UPI003F4893F2
MIIINSGAYVIPEFQAEVGKIPPCFLPIGNKKLLEHQVQVLKNEINEPIVLSLPDSYLLNRSEQLLLEELEVDLIQVPSDFSLGENILYVLNTIDTRYRSEPIRFLHGDTLIRGLQCIKGDCIGIGYTNELYNWEAASTLNLSENSFKVWCGFFSFSNVSKLIRLLAINRGDFTKSVHEYHDLYELTEVVFDKWYDCGHINSFFKTRGEMTTERAFNEIRMIENVIYKSGSFSSKIEAEAYWFESLPAELKRFTPHLIDSGTSEEGFSYALEYLPNLPLNELFVHGKLHHNQWVNIINKIAAFISSSSQVEIDPKLLGSINKSFTNLVVDKTCQRIMKYSSSNNIDLDKSFVVNNQESPSLNSIISRCIDKILALPTQSSVLHGDLCFSNILYDSRINDIKLIDPRGMDFHGNFTIYGDQRYDIAKLTHSVIGLYDHIIANRYKLEVIEDYQYNLSFELSSEIEEFQHFFLTKSFNGIEVKSIMPLTVLLFLSMLPLHSDREDRQQALLINAIRLYNEFLA